MKTFKEYLAEKFPFKHCWKGYARKGKKMKNGKMVPNCVKKPNK